MKVGKGGLKERRVIRAIWVSLALADFPAKMEFQVSLANQDILENQAKLPQMNIFLNCVAMFCATSSQHCCRASPSQ